MNRRQEEREIFRHFTHRIRCFDSSPTRLSRFFNGHEKSPRFASVLHRTIRHFTHLVTEVSTVYTPVFVISPTKFRQFTHRPFLKRSQVQGLIDHYPQRNSLFNTSI